LGALSGYQTKWLRKRSLLTAALAVATTIVVPWQLLDTCLLNRQFLFFESFISTNISIYLYIYIYIYIFFEDLIFSFTNFLINFFKKIQKKWKLACRSCQGSSVLLLLHYLGCNWICNRYCCEWRWWSIIQGLQHHHLLEWGTLEALFYSGNVKFGLHNHNSVCGC